VVVVGDVAGVDVPHLAGRVAEGVPDGGAAAVFAGGAFDLEGGGGGTDDEVVGEVQSAVAVVRVSGGGHDSIVPQMSCVVGALSRTLRSSIRHDLLVPRAKSSVLRRMGD